MFFGLPWFAVVGIVSTIVVFFFAYKSKELEVEEKIKVKAREVHDLEKLVHNLKSRVDQIENQLNNHIAKNSGTERSAQIEINDELESQNPDNDPQSGKSKVKS
ncbi:hypothetical protein AB2B38_007605 [Balneola sp. MJW-20]|uniref:hypothetical protein n=1 Tax=Gracilimonas aurantiaca TaxID=3234185 RepID=UPI0034668E50